MRWKFIHQNSEEKLRKFKQWQADNAGSPVVIIIGLVKATKVRRYQIFE